MVISSVDGGVIFMVVIAINVIFDWGTITVPGQLSQVNCYP